MSVVVHLRNGQIAELQTASSCTWTPAAGKKSGNEVPPRMLVCRNERGNVVASYKEPEVIGYRKQPVQSVRRFRFPTLRRKATS